MTNTESKLREANETHHQLSSAFLELGFSIIHIDTLKEDQGIGLPYPHQFLRKDYQEAPSLYLRLGIPFNAKVEEFMGIEAEERGDPKVYETAGPFNHGLLPFLQYLSHDPLLKGVIQRMGFEFGSSSTSKLYMGPEEEKMMIEGFNLYPQEQFQVGRSSHSYDYLKNDPQLIVVGISQLDQMLKEYHKIAMMVDKYKHHPV